MMMILRMTILLMMMMSAMGLVFWVGGWLSDDGSSHIHDDGFIGGAAAETTAIRTMGSVLSEQR